jgi:dCMP deaminase
MSHWDGRFLSLAHLVGTWSKDPSTKVGACIVRPDRTIAAVGYNGFPRGTKDDPALLVDRDVKYLRTVHAEMNAILSAHEPVRGYTLYVTPLYPCANCASVIIQAGIARVVALMPDLPERWADNMKVAQGMFSEAGVEVVLITA